MHQSCTPSNPAFTRANYDASLRCTSGVRFISEDPIGMDGGLNLYAYAANNPVMLTDPSGNCPWCAAGVGAISGGYGAYITSGGDWRSVLVGAFTGGVAGIINPVGTIRNIGVAFGANVFGQGVGNVIAQKPVNDIDYGSAAGAALFNPAARTLGAAAASAVRAVHPGGVAAFTSGAVTAVGEITGSNFIGGARASQGTVGSGK